MFNIMSDDSKDGEPMHFVYDSADSIEKAVEKAQVVAIYCGRHAKILQDGIVILRVFADATVEFPETGRLIQRAMA